MDGDVEFPGAGVRLSATITCPRGVSPAPGVVLIGGSGPADRHNDGLFDRLRDHLVGAGVAVLAYDKRGVGRSTGVWSVATVDELAGDAAAAVARLRAHPGVAADSVGVLGHSEGGWVALRLGAQLNAPGHLILNSCPAVSFVDAEVFALTSAGAERDAAADLMRQLISTAQAGETYERGRDILTAYRNESWYAPALGDFTLNVDSWAQLRAWAGYAPDDDLARLQIPTLAIFGEKDPLVPVTASMASYDQSATNAPRVHRSVVFTGADHRLRTAGTEDFASGYLALLSTWCRDPPAAGSHARTSFT